MNNNSLFILTCSCLMPAIMIILGFLMWKHHPKKISYIFGYRTARSMRNLETWNYANEYAGKLWFILGLATLIPTLAIYIPFLNSNDERINIITLGAISIQAILFAGSFLFVELSLKKKFK